MTKVVKLNLTQQQAVEMLAEADHCFLTKNAVEAITKPFGFVGTTYVARNTIHEDPKGLLLADGLQEAEGQDAAVTAQQVCRHVGVEYLPMFGRGSQLRACIEALRKHLETKQDIGDRMKAAGFRKTKQKR